MSDIENWGTHLQQLIREPIIAVLEIEEASEAVPLGKALVAGGVSALEITLRTDAALEAIRLISNEVEDTVVGVGTLVKSSQVDEAKRAGAVFGVSPGISADVIAECKQCHFPLLPGVSTVTETMSLLDNGITFAKFFPAEPAGGAPFLRSMGGPLPDMKFCPTGGITASNAPDYLALNNVHCVGGSWVAPRQLVRDQAFEKIEARAKEALNGLRKGKE